MCISICNCKWIYQKLVSSSLLNLQISSKQITGYLSYNILWIKLSIWQFFVNVCILCWADSKGEFCFCKFSFHLVLINFYFNEILKKTNFTVLRVFCCLLLSPSTSWISYFIDKHNSKGKQYYFFSPFVLMFEISICLNK